MEVFIAPSYNETKSVDPKIAKALLSNYDAHITRDGRMAVSNGGYITCELPALNATEREMADQYRICHESVKASEERMARARAKAEMDGSTEYVKDCEQGHQRSWDRFSFMNDLIDRMYLRNPLKAAAIKAAAGFMY